MAAFFGGSFFLGVHLAPPFFGFESLLLDPSHVMASTDTESFEACSPTGSVLIYPDMRSSGPAPVHSLPALTDLETALHDDEKESVLPTDDYAHRRHSGDGFQWDTVDPALIRFTLDESDSFEYHTPTEQPNSYNTSERDGTSCENIPATTNDAPFHRWMKTLRRRAAQRRHTATMDEMLFDSPSVEDLRQTSNKSSHLHRRLSSSGSSMGFVEAVKTASVSLASGSILARSRRNSMRSSRTRTQTDRSSRASTSSNRCSEDSVGLDKPIFLDKAAVERSLQRRRILEELISTEEGYIGDVRFLMNVSAPPIATCYLSTLLNDGSRFMSRSLSHCLPCLWVCGHP